MTQPPPDPPPGSPSTDQPPVGSEPAPPSDRIEVDGGAPNGFVVVVLDRDVDLDPTRDLDAVLRDPPSPGAPQRPFPERLLAELAALGNPATSRLVPARSVDAERRLQERGRRRRRTPSRDLTRFWRIDLTDGRADPREIARRLSGLPGVDLAYAESQVASSSPPVEAPPTEAPPTAPPPTSESARPASAVGPSALMLAAMLSQNYLAAAPQGVGADAVRTRCGAGGEGIKLIDVEEGWQLGHPAYSGHAPDVLHMDNRAPGDHGTAVLGIVAASGAGVLVRGIAPRLARVRCSSHYDAATNTPWHTAAAIVEAADHLDDGDVLLIEVNRVGEDGRLLPTEIDPADFEKISDATGAGIVVIEAAGNGRRDLDSWRHPADDRSMARDGDGDSEAIIVGSCVAQTIPIDATESGHARFPSSNWGERVDCYAWGELVATSSAVQAGGYTPIFGETSAASAIVAGVAVAVQGMQRATHPGSPLDSRSMRDTLKGPGSTAQHMGTQSRRIGRMPNLATLADQIGAGECPQVDDGGGVIGR